MPSWSDRDKRAGRTRDDASLFGQSGRERHIVVGLKWVDRGRMLPGSICALGRALMWDERGVLRGSSRPTIDRASFTSSLLSPSISILIRYSASSFSFTSQPGLTPGAPMEAPIQRLADTSGRISSNWSMKFSFWLKLLLGLNGSV
ncbi:unnamed protein product [Microthlaspi erraticum]|uniref:Uncharacterized protein n=1 Tax=Microthlaspi erraticum TaxID=1685480 RepID=A0A6D2LDF0_9BRAS|nr:unnamed protein product [Microthlaspi erraticum]